jgi:hypothetical protein
VSEHTLALAASGRIPPPAVRGPKRLPLLFWPTLFVVLALGYAGAAVSAVVRWPR